MRIEIKALQQELPALDRLEIVDLCEMLAGLGFPVDAVESVNGETVLEVDVTPNRGDAMSHRGLARDLGARLAEELTPWAVQAVTECAPGREIRLEAGAAGPLYATALLELGTSQGTPGEVQAFLASMGSNAKNLPPVDASNEILHRVGHPTHAFDADKVKGAVSIRWAKTGERLVTLDGVDRKLTVEDLVIADEEGPIALAGVMGGDGSKVTAETRRVLLESAYFDARTVRATSRRHSLHSDASHRFGRGADPAMAQAARDLLVQRLVDWSGARILSAWTVGEVPGTARPIGLRATVLCRIAGETLELVEAQELLRRLGCAVTVHGDALQVVPPAWRHDLAIEEDLAEEVLRLRGYERIPSFLPPLEGSPEPLSQTYIQPLDLARRLAHLGFHQTVTLGFISPEADAAYLARVPEVENPAAGRMLGNPLGVEYSIMRASLLPSLQAAGLLNVRQGAKDVRLFEVAPVFTSSPEGPQEALSLGIVWGGILGGEDFLTKARSPQAADLIGVVRDLGFLGEPRIHDLGEGLLGLEIPLSELPVRPSRIIPVFEPFSRFPAMERDISLLVGMGQSYRELSEAMEASLRDRAGSSFQSLRCVDIFRHKSLPEGRQAWLMRMRFQHASRTLTAEEVDGWVSATLGAARTFGAELRG